MVGDAAGVDIHRGPRRDFATDLFPAISPGVRLGLADSGIDDPAAGIYTSPGSETPWAVLSGGNQHATAAA